MEAVYSVNILGSQLLETKIQNSSPIRLPCPLRIIFFLPILSIISVLIRTANTCMTDKRTIMF